MSRASVLFKNAAIDAALKSGAFIRKSVGKVKNISYKGRANLVTDVDKASEAIIIDKLSAVFPDHSILSEEREPKRRASQYRWVVDPIDGTTNFAHQFPFFCVSIALEKEGKVVLGVVYDPTRDELFIAEEGKGSHLNGHPITVTKTKYLSLGFLATGFAYGIEEAKNKNIKNFKNFLMSAQAIRRAGSAALDLCYVACGRFDGFWEMGLHPWDSAAGTLLVREAGGLVTKFDNSFYDHYDKEVLASNGCIHKQMVKILSPRSHLR